MRKTKGEKIQPCVISMIKINSNVWLIGPPRPLHWHNLNKLKNRTRLKKQHHSPTNRALRHSLFTEFLLHEACFSLQEPHKASLPGGMPHWKVRVSSVFTVSITSHYTSEQGHHIFKGLHKEDGNTRFPSPAPCHCLIVMHVLEIYMEAGKPAFSLLQSLRAMCVIWPHVSWKSCIPTHSCTGQMEFFLCQLSN